MTATRGYDARPRTLASRAVYEAGRRRDALSVPSTRTAASIRVDVYD